MAEETSTHIIPAERVDEIKTAEPKAVFLGLELGGEEHQFAFKRPLRVHLQMLFGATKKDLGVALFNIAASNLIEPARPTFDVICNEFPGAAVSLANKLLEAAGVKDAEVLHP